MQAESGIEELRNECDTLVVIPNDRLLQLGDRNVSVMDAFRTAFIEAGKTQFGSGWAWLEWRDGRLAVTKTPNGENPLATGGRPILGVDVWEHSYYIDYRNLRPKYIETFLTSLVNWDFVTQNLKGGR